MKKRFFAGILALCMLLTMLPMAAFAAEGEQPATTAPDKPEEIFYLAEVDNIVAASGLDKNDTAPYTFSVKFPKAPTIEAGKIIWAKVTFPDTTEKAGEKVLGIILAEGPAQGTKASDHNIFSFSLANKSQFEHWPEGIEPATTADKLTTGAYKIEVFYGDKPAKADQNSSRDVVADENIWPELPKDHTPLGEATTVEVTANDDAAEKEGFSVIPVTTSETILGKQFPAVTAEKDASGNYTLAGEALSVTDKWTDFSSVEEQQTGHYIALKLYDALHRPISIKSVSEHDLVKRIPNGDTLVTRLENYQSGIECRSTIQLGKEGEGQKTINLNMDALVNWFESDVTIDDVNFKADPYEAKKLTEKYDNERDTLWFKVNGLDKTKEYQVNIAGPVFNDSPDVTTLNDGETKKDSWLLRLSLNSWNEATYKSNVNGKYTITVYEKPAAQDQEKAGGVPGKVVATATYTISKLTIDANGGYFNQIFEHEDKGEKHYYNVEATYTPAPTPAPTEEPTPDPTADPTAEPTTEPTEEPSPSPDSTEEPEANKENEEGKEENSGEQPAAREGEPSPSAEPTAAPAKISIYVGEDDLSAIAEASDNASLDGIMTFATRKDGEQVGPENGKWMQYVPDQVHDPVSYEDTRTFMRWEYADGTLKAMTDAAPTPTPTPAPPVIPPIVSIPTAAPTSEPTPAPSSEPTSEPTTEPTSQPSDKPTSTPTPTPGAVEIKPEVTVDENGVASAEVAGDQANQLVEAAKGDDVTNVTVKVEAPEDSAPITEATVALPGQAVEQLGSEANVDMTIDTPVGNVTLPGSSLSSLGKDAEKVTVTVAQKDDSTVAIEVKKDGQLVEKDLELKAELPASNNVSNTTVAVIVDKNGKETIVPKSVAENGKVTVLLKDGSATLKIKDNKKTFQDKIPSWAQDKVDFMASRELMVGNEKGLFAPDTKMNRAMLVQVLFSLESKPDTGVTDMFGDVKPGKWYTAAVSWGAQSGVIAGKPNGDFAPNENVTRETIAVILYAYAKHCGMDTTVNGSISGFGDASKVSGWAKNAMNWAIGAGVISGDGKNLNPKGEASRAEVATMITGFIKTMTK